MNAHLSPYPEYEESLAYIQEAAVQEAFVYLVDRAQRIPGFTARPKPHGYINRNLHYFDTENSSPYAFTVGRRWLLFYLRAPRQTHPSVSVETLKQAFDEVNLLQDGQLTFRIRSLADAKAAMLLVFPDLIAAAGISFPDDVPDGATYVEGAVTVVRVNSFERNREAREACLRHYGHDCSVCGFSFSKAYGSLGEDYIHVHHLIELAAIRAEYEVDAIRDLRPVCPNCHAMLHRRTPPLSIEELQRHLALANEAATRTAPM